MRPVVRRSRPRARLLLALAGLTAPAFGGCAGTAVNEGRPAGLEDAVAGPGGGAGAADPDLADPDLADPDLADPDLDDELPRGDAASGDGAGELGDAAADSAEDAPRVGPYLWARLLDVTDIVSIRGAAGPGLLAHARVTPWVQAGVGYLGPATSWGGGFSVADHVFGWGLREGGLWTERRGELGISTLYYCEAEVETIAGTRTRVGAAARGDWDVGAELHLGLLGLAIDLRPDELLDFLAGLGGGDPAGDDPP